MIRHVAFFILIPIIVLASMLTLATAAPKQKTAAKSKPPAIKQVQVFGQKINYLEAGAGPNVILLHGLGDDLSVWADTVKALSPNYHVWAPDQLGFGKSDKPFLDYRVAVLVDFLGGFCKKVGIRNATVVGNSLGGWVAAAFALASPDIVDRLVLVGSAGYWPAHAGVPEVTREFLTLLNPTTLAAFKEILSLLFYDQTLITDAFVEEAYTTQLKRNDGYTINRFIESILRREDRLDGKTREIKAPTLIVWGREDAATPLAIGETLAKEIPYAQKAIIDRCGHMPQMECARPFNAALLNFLNSNPTAAVGAKKQIE